MKSFLSAYAVRHSLKRWLQTNQEVYLQFKIKIQSVLESPSWDMIKQLDEAQTEYYQNCLNKMEALEEVSEEEVVLCIEKALKEDDQDACCWYCFLILDQGYETFQQAIERFKQSDDGRLTRDCIQSYLQIHAQESQQIVHAELSLLGLRRWHYEHSKEYSDFLNSFRDSYEGNMDFAYKGIFHLVDMLSFKGLKEIISLFRSHCPGTEEHQFAQLSECHTTMYEQLDCLFGSSVDKAIPHQKLLRNNPYLFSAYYWMIFDDGFIKLADWVSASMLKADSSRWKRILAESIIESLVHTSFNKLPFAYSKKKWESMSKGVAKEKVQSILQKINGRRGRKQVYVLLEEMLNPDDVHKLMTEITSILTEWKEEDGEKNTILACLYAALTNCRLLNGTFNYRTFHAAILERFPSLGFKAGFDYAEALYYTILDGNICKGNTSLTDSVIQKGKNKAQQLGLHFRIVLSSDVY